MQFSNKMFLKPGSWALPPPQQLLLIHPLTLAKRFGRQASEKTGFCLCLTGIRMQGGADCSMNAGLGSCLIHVHIKSNGLNKHRRLTANFSQFRKHVHESREVEGLAKITRPVRS